MKNNNTFTILLIAGSIILVNLLSKQLFFRLDMTENKEFTLSKATKNILKELEEPVTVTAYFSNDLAPEMANVKEDFKALLTEYNQISKGNVDFQFVSPNDDPKIEQEVMQQGISPALFNSREKDQMKQQKIYMGAVVKLAEASEVIPFIQPGSAMEYALTTSIKKIAIKNKPAIGLISGHGEASLQDLMQANEALSILYKTEALDLSKEPQIPALYKTLAMIKPQDSIPPDHFAKLDAFLERGGNLVVAVNEVTGDFQSGQGTALQNPTVMWLKQKGVDIQSSFVIDASCATVTVQQQQGMFSFQTPVQFPYLPLVKSFAQHPITKGLEQVVFKFVSPIQLTGNAKFTALLTSSPQSGIANPPLMFDVQKNWTQADFNQGNQILAGILEIGNGKMVIFADGDFPINEGRGQRANEDNISLLVNAIDFLSDDTGLIDLRTKSVNTRPIEELEDGKRSMYKYLNFLMPIGLVLLYGFYRSNVNRNTRMRRMQERYN